MVTTIEEHYSPLITTLQNISIPFHTPASPSFEILVRPFNRAFSFEPLAVVLPETTEHVSEAVLAAKAAGVKVQARSGGHSYAAHSTGGQDGSLIIDMRNFQSVSVDQETGLVRVGAGVRLGTLATELWKQGRRAIPHGTHPGSVWSSSL
jgi:FAD/FMN-containing dehydrogenase